MINFECNFISYSFIKIPFEFEINFWQSTYAVKKVDTFYNEELIFVALKSMYSGLKEYFDLSE